MNINRPPSLLKKWAAPLTLAIIAIMAVSVIAATIMASQTTAHAQSAPTASPTGLNVTSFAHNRVQLQWNNPEDDSITGYRILRRDTVNQPPGTFHTVEADTGTSSTSYTDNSVSAGVRYAYRVKAINTAGTSQRSNYVNVTTPSQPQTPTPQPTTPQPTATPDAAPTLPAAPTGLSATDVSHQQVTLTWDDPENSSITGHQVLRRTRDGDQYGDGQGASEFVVIINDTGSAAPTYNDTSVSPRTRYVYRVKARNAAGLGPRSTYLNVETSSSNTTPTPSPTTTATPTPTATATPTATPRPTATPAATDQLGGRFCIQTTGRGRHQLLPKQNSVYLTKDTFRHPETNRSRNGLYPAPTHAHFLDAWHPYIKGHQLAAKRQYPELASPAGNSHVASQSR